MEYGAIDLHTKHSQIRIVTADGTVVLDRRIVTRPDQFAAMFGGRDRLRILLEASTESEWVATCLEGLGHEVVVADPNFAAMYGTRTRRIKTDRRDVAALADANRTGVYRPAYRVSPAQRAVRQRLLVRDQLVRLRTQLINLLRSQVRATGRRVPTGAAETFGRRFAALELPALVREALRPLTDLLEGLAIPLREAEAWAHQAAAADPVARRLMTAPGVGPVTALSYRATLGQVERFPDAGRVTAYLGLVPREDSSAERRHRGAITKAGPGRPRALLVQASWHIWRNSRGDATALHAWVHRVAARRGRRIALVALARRLARCLYAMWRDSRNFDGTRVRVIAAAAQRRRSTPRVCSDGQQNGVAVRNASWPHVRAGRSIARHASVSHTAPAISIATTSANRRMRDVAATAVPGTRPELGKSGLRKQNSVEHDLDFSRPLHRRNY